MPSEDYWFDRKADTGNHRMHVAYEYAKAFIAQVENTQLDWDDPVVQSTMTNLRNQIPIKEK